MKDNSSESRSVLTTLHKMMNIVYFTNIISQQNISNATSSDLCNVQNRDFKTFLL